MQGAFAGRLRFARSGTALVDLLAILPFFLEVILHHLVDLRFLRVFRLMRLLKLTRYTGATKTLGIVMKREWPVLTASAFVMLLLVLLTASLGYLFEHEAQPDKFENIPQSIYWAVVTLASVGYGDISPITPAGRAMTIVLALLGIGIFAIPAALLSSAFSDQLRIERETLQNELYDMLADGRISEEERELIDAEAKRLHLSHEEVERLIEKAHRQREATSNHALMSMPQLIAQPAAAGCAISCGMDISAWLAACSRWRWALSIRRSTSSWLRCRRLASASMMPCSSSEIVPSANMLYSSFCRVSRSMRS